MFEYKKNIILRFFLFVFALFVIWGTVIATKAAVVMFKERSFWQQVRERSVKYNQPIEPKRGNILSDNGELMVSTLPKYRLHIDFVYRDPNKQVEKKIQIYRDSIWRADMKALCKGLSEIFPDRSAAQFEKHLTDGLKHKRRYHWLYPGPVSYTQYKKIKQLPIMSLRIAYSGLITEPYIDRKRLFGSLAECTFGNVLTGDEKGKKVFTTYGLEKKYDKYLKGKPGVKHREKAGKQYIDRIDVPAENGMDIQTTLNIEMQDICEKALVGKLKEHDAMSGWAILMEVKTGDIKAIVNMTKVGEGQYIETYETTQYNSTPNHSMCNLMEPGSIFKTVALAAALDEGKIHPEDSVYTYGGQHTFYGRSPISDTHKPAPGQKKFSITEVLKYSSNIGMGQIINNGYKNNPEEFTDKLRAMGMNDNYKLIDEEVTPYYKTPKNKRWSKSDLVSMSYGYATMMTSINMVTFYNTVANRGKQMKPRLVKSILKESNIVEEFEPEVLRNNVLSESTANTLTEMLVQVVNAEDGTGGKAKSEKVLIAGKTGTARIAKNGSYKYSPIEYLLSFCGFFPAEAPQYTCIVQMINNKPPRSGGMTSGVVFKEIAEKIMAKKQSVPLIAAKDTLHNPIPTAKRGNMNATNWLLDELGFDTDDENIEDTQNDIAWGSIKCDSTGNLSFKIQNINEETIPNVIGMGAKDALYLMKKAGLRTSINGYGKVVAQSIPGGEKIRKGATIMLTLKP